MKKIILIHGMKRSGNHGIINWLKAHDRFIFFNNVIPIAKILKGVRPFPAPMAFERWVTQRLAPETHRGQADQDPEGRSVIASLEDHELHIRPFFEAPCELSNVLILRDPHNLLASRIRKASLIDNPAYPRRPGPGMDRVITLWKQHAREFLGLTNDLENRTCIYFNAWFSDPDYRARISEQLGFEPTDAGFSRVSKIGGGSSFDGTQFDGKNQQLDVLDRRRHLKDSEQEFLDQVIDGEMRELAERIAAAVDYI